MSCEIIDSDHGEQQKMSGQYFDPEDELVRGITRNSLNTLEEYCLIKFLLLLQLKWSIFKSSAADFLTNVEDMNPEEIECDFLLVKEILFLEKLKSSQSNKCLLFIQLKIAASSSQERNMSDADASDSSMVEQLKKLLMKYGTELLKPCDSTEELLRKLDKLEHLLSHAIQDDKKLLGMALQPSKEALIANELMRHAELDVRVSVASCISEIIRITAPDEPYEEDQMKEFFQLANSAFESLSCMSGRAYSKAVSILQTISYSQSCVVMLDLELYTIVHQMFHLFLDGIRPSHSHNIFSSMENIMTLIIRNNVDYDEFSLALVKILLNHLKKENQNVSPVTLQLAENIFKNCSGDLKTYLPEAVRCLGIPVEDYAEVVVSLFQEATQRENVDSKDIAGDVSCPGEAGLAIEVGLYNLTEGHETENFKNDENCNESQWNEPENLGRPTHMQQEQKPEDVPILKKRTRKPNSLIKAEEGYDPFWMCINWTSLEDNHCRKHKRKKLKSKISKDSFLLSKPVREHSSAPISPKANKIKKVSEKRQGSYVKIPFEQKSSGKTIVSEDLTRDIIVKNHSEKGQGSSTKVAPANKSRRNTVICEDVTEDILIQTLASQSRPVSSKVEALSGKVSNPQHKRKSITSKEEASKVSATSRSFGKEVVGCKIKVWWPLDETFYEGQITAFDHIYKIHQVEYDDGDIEILDLTKECWQMLGDDNLFTHEQEIVSAPSASTEMLNGRGRKSSHLSKRKKPSKVSAASRSFGEEVVGRKIKVWWPLDEMFNKGKITAFDHIYKIHQVEYDDGVIEILDLTKENWQLLGDNNLSTHGPEIVVAPSASTETLNGRGTKSPHLSKRKRVVGESLALPKSSDKKKEGLEKSERMGEEEREGNAGEVQKTRGKKKGLQRAVVP